MQMAISPQDILTLGIAALINILITIMFCKSLTKTLSYVDPENKAIQPVMIWMLLIPGLNYLLNFFVVFGMTKSIYNELESRNFEEVNRPAFTSGIIFATLSLLAAITLFVPIPKSLAVAAGVVGFAQIFFFIQYWMKINWYKAILKQDEEGASSEDEI